MEEERMMNTYKNYALICASLFILSGCLEEKFEPQGTPAEIGDEVIFGARAGFENPNPDTKTVYVGNTYQENGKVFHSIDWVYGKDKIEIYSPQGIGINPSCYTVNKSVIENGNENDYAYLTRNNSNGAIQWGNEEAHDFYAMYPSSDTFINSDATLRDGVRLVGTTVNGVIPDEQIPLSVSNIVNEQSTPHWVAQPNMEYAYMVAHNRANKSSGSVNVTFYPIVTAVEIELTFSVPKDDDNLDKEYIDQLTITHAKVESDTQLTGSFTCNLEDWAYPEGRTEPIENKGYPTCTGNKEDSYDNEVIVPLYDSNGAAITLEDGGSIKFTVFVLPHTDIDNLKVSFSSNAGTNYQGKVLDFENVKDDKGNPIIIKKHCKNLITNLSLPANWVGKPTLSAGNWITNLSDDVNLNKLSIPGTGGSFSFAYTNSNNRAAYAQQFADMDIEEQWNLGIRAFEIVCDRPQQPTTSLGGQPIRCNKTSMGEHTVYSAILDLINRVTQTDENGQYVNAEMAVVILTYQPESGTGIPRNAAAYAKSLKKLLTESEKGLANYVDNETLILFTPNLTIGEARNKVMIICRINQEGEGEPLEDVVSGQSPATNTDNTFNNFIVATKELADLPVLIINGCGTAKD